MTAPRFEDIEGEDVESVPDFDAIQGEDEGDAAPMLDPASISMQPYGPEFRPEELGGGYSDARGAVASVLQGVGLNWADEAAGLQAQAQLPIKDSTPENQAAAYKEGRDRLRATEGRFREENPKTAFGLSVLGGLISPTPGSASTAFGTRVAGAAASGALAGAGSSLEKEGMAYGAALGAPLGAAGQALGEAGGDLFARFLTWAGGKAGGKVATAEQKALEMGAEKVAADIASAKGKLGSVTQEANRAVENLLRLESTGALTSEQAAVLAALRQNGVLPALEQKLADSMLEQVPGAAGRVDIARSAMEGITARSNEATEEAAQAILSGSEAKKQIGERVKRYLPTIVGSTLGAGAGGAAGAMLGGSPTEALVGALAGAGVRPAIRAGQRMLAHPAVQRGIYAPLERLAGAAARAVEGGMPALMGSGGRTATGQSAQMPQGAMVEELATNNPQALGSYAATLQRAAAEGTLSLVHWNLQQTDPQYRAMLEALRKEQQ